MLPKLNRGRFRKSAFDIGKLEKFVGRKIN
jgi:hypothetical protein